MWGGCIAIGGCHTCKFVSGLDRSQAAVYQRHATRRSVSSSSSAIQAPMFRCFEQPMSDQLLADAHVLE